MENFKNHGIGAIKVVGSLRDNWRVRGVMGQFLTNYSMKFSKKNSALKYKIKIYVEIQKLINLTLIKIMKVCFFQYNFYFIVNLNSSNFVNKIFLKVLILFKIRVV